MSIEQFDPVRLGVPTSYEHAADAYKARAPFLPLVENYLEEPKDRYLMGDGMLLAGSYGSGKTWTAVAVARTLGRLIGRDLVPIMLASSEIAATIYPMGQDKYLSAWDKTYSQVLETCPCLIIDEFGAEIRAGGSGPIVLQRLRRLLKARCDDRVRRVTFITTNLRHDDMADTVADEMGPAIASVIDELCQWQPKTYVEAPDNRYQFVKRF